MREDLKVMYDRVWRRPGLAGRIKEASVKAAKLGYQENRASDRHWTKDTAKKVGITSNTLNRMVNDGYERSGEDPTGKPLYRRKLPRLPVAMAVLKELDPKRYAVFEHESTPRRHVLSPAIPVSLKDTLLRIRSFNKVPKLNLEELSDLVCQLFNHVGDLQKRLQDVEKRVI